MRTRVNTRLTSDASFGKDYRLWVTWPSIFVESEFFKFVRRKDANTRTRLGMFVAATKESESPGRVINYYKETDTVLSMSTRHKPQHHWQ